MLNIVGKIVLTDASFWTHCTKVKPTELTIPTWPHESLLIDGYAIKFEGVSPNLNINPLPMRTIAKGIQTQLPN